jgi:hypothetical protein
MIKYLGLMVLPTIAFASFNPTSENDCSTIDLRNEQINYVRNQKEIAWCYAFTAADMLGYTFKTNEKVSAADVALNYNSTGVGRFAGWLNRTILQRNDSNVRNEAHQTGFNKIALNQAMSEGYCPESVFPSEDWTELTRVGGNWESKQVTLQKAMHAITNLHANRSTLTAENLPYYYSFKNITPEKFVSLIKTKKLVNFYNSLRLLACKDDRKELDHHWKVKMVFKNKKIFWRLGEQLERGRPVGLDYDSRILRDRNQRGMSLSRLHTSTVIGRRWHKESQTCQFLVRDSYGDQCNKYDPSYDCEGGKVWLRESQIYPNMTSIVYMLSRVN